MVFRSFDVCIQNMSVVLGEGGQEGGEKERA